MARDPNDSDDPGKIPSAAGCGLPATQFFEGFGDILQGTRGGWSAGKVLTAWLALAAMHFVTTFAFEALSRGVAITVSVVTALILTALAGLVISTAAGWEFGTGGRWAPRRSVELLVARSATVLKALLYTDIHVEWKNDTDKELEDSEDMLPKGLVR